MFIRHILTSGLQLDFYKVSLWERESRRGHKLFENRKMDV